MSSEDQAYYLDRADAERKLADAAADDRARHAHSILSGLYLNRVYPPEFGGGAALETR